MASQQQEQPQSEGAEGAPAVEGDAATETDETESTEGDEATETTETAAEGAEGEAKTEGEEAKAEPAEAELQAAAEKYAKEKIAAANKTMAAARRAEQRVETIKQQNTALTAELDEYKGFVQQLRTDAPAALARLGFASVKAFLDNIIATGGDKPEPTLEERFEADRRERKEREENDAKARAAATADAFQAHLFAAVDEQKATYTRMATRHGKAVLWSAVSSYASKHRLPVHEVPPAAIGQLADVIESDLRAEFGEPDSGRPPAKTGTTATGGAAPGASTSGKTLAGKATSGAPSAKEYSLDPDERRRQVNEDLKADGLL